MGALLSSTQAFIKTPWPNQVIQAEGFLIPACAGLSSPNLPPDIISQWMTTTKAYGEVSIAANTLLSRLGQITSSSGDPTPSPKTSQVASECTLNLQAILASTKAPPRADSVDPLVLNSIVKNINKWLDNGGDQLEVEIDTQLLDLNKLISVPSSSNESDLFQTFQDINSGLLAVVVSLNTGTQDLMASVDGGELLKRVSTLFISQMLSLRRSHRSHMYIRPRRSWRNKPYPRASPRSNWLPRGPRNTEYQKSRT